MGFNEFWLQFNNGKKEQLNDTKHGVRKEQVDKKFHNLFDAYDTNNDEVLEENEAKIIYAQLKEFAGDNVFDSEENLKTMSLFAEQANIENVDYQGFIKSISDAAANIISFKENVTDDGGKEITTEYKDGTKQTIAYYQNGDFKWKKTEKKYKKTVYEIVLNGERREVTEEQFKQAQKKVEETKKQSDKITVQKGKEKQKSLSVSAPAPDIQGYSTTKKWEEKTQEFSPRFIAENLGVDINTEEGKKILERLSYLPKEALEGIKDGAELKDILVQNDLSADFNNISNILEILYGVTIRNDVELEESEEQRKQLLSQIQTVGIMSELYARVAEYYDTYTDNQGVFGLGSEGIGWILNKIGIQGENHYQWADSCREFIQKINEFKVLNSAKFNEEFKELTGKEKFNVEALQKMVELAKDGKAQDEYGDYTDEYKQAVKEFSNFDVTNINARAWYHPDNIISGFGEALAMIATLGWGAETKAGQMLATSTMATFSKAGVAVASKQVNNRLLQGALRISGKGIKLIGPALNEGTKMYAYTAVMGTATNIANRAIKFDSEENTLDKFLQTEAMVLDNATGSFGFGAFAGVFGSTVTQKVMQRASRVSTKVGTALSDKFAKGAVDANEVFTTILEKSAPTKIAEVAALATDVLGFTAFESVLAIVKNLDNFPDGYSVEDLTNIIWEELKNQGYNLFQIKIVAWLLSSRSARMQATRYMKDAMPQLKGATVEWVNEGKDGYKINLPDGRKIKCKNTTEYISALHLMVRGETAFSEKFDVKNRKTSDGKTLEGGVKDTELTEVAPFANRLNESVTAKDLIYSGKEKTVPFADGSRVKELSDTEFKELKVRVEQKINKLPKNTKEFLMSYVKTITKENIQIVERFVSTKDVYDKVGLFFDALNDLKNINQAKMFEFVMDNYAEFSTLSTSRIIETTKTPEQLQLRIELMKMALTNQQFRNSSHLKNIVLNAKSIEDAINTFEYTEKYGVTEKARADLSKQFGEEKADKMINDFTKAKEEFGLNVDNLICFGEHIKNTGDLSEEQAKNFSYEGDYITAKSTYPKENLTFYFDKNSGELVAFKDDKNNIVYNLNAGKIIKTFPTEIWYDKKSLGNNNKLLGAITETTDLRGNWLGSVEFVKSKIDGEFEIYEYDTNGKRYKSGLVEFDKQGGKHIEKRTTSLDGTVTEQVYADDKLGNRYMYYKTTDSSGKVLYESTKIFKVIDKNHFVSTDDGISYDIQYTNENVTITKLDKNGKKTQEKVVYKIKDYTQADYSKIENFEDKVYSDSEKRAQLENGEKTLGELMVEAGIYEPHTIDRKLLPALKQLSGEEWFQYEISGTEAITLANVKDNGHSTHGTIGIGKDRRKDASLLEHESGHEKDNLSKWSEDEEFVRIYNEEKALCQKYMPEIELEQLDYFMVKHLSEPMGETGAEANQITNIPNSRKSIGSRSMFAQKVLPRTIAYVANKNRGRIHSNTSEVKPVQKTEFKSWEDIEQNKNNLGKDFSAVQMKIINEYLLNDFEEIIPEHMTIIEKMLNTKSLTPDEIIKLIKSEKIPQDELFKIDEYAKVAEEQGFNIVQMMESSEQEFNTYIEQESQRIAEGKIKVNEPETKITVTDNKSSLLEQIKNKFKYYNLKEAKEELKSLTKEEVQKLSELLASDKYLKDRLGRYYDLKDYVRIAKNSGDADLELAKECLKNGFHLNFYHGLADVIDNNSARREVAFELLKLHSQFKQVKQHSAYQYQSNIVAEEAYWNYILKDIKTEGQKDAYLLYLKSVRLEEISDHSAIQPNMRYINNVDEMQAWLEIKDYKRSYHREELRQTYIKLSPEDRKLFTKEQFDYENQWDSGFGRLIDVMKLLLDPNIKSGYKEEIREFLKKNPDDMMTFKIMRAIDCTGEKPVFNIEHFRRIARFANAGVEYDQYRFENLTEGYKNEDGTFHYAYDNAYLDRWYEALTNGAEEKTLGRRFTMEEAKSVSYIREDWKKDFVIKHLKEGMREYDISRLCQDVNCNVEVPEQLRITEILWKYKEGFPVKDGEPVKFGYDVNKSMKTKEDIDAFCKVFSGEPLTKKQVNMYSAMFGTGFGKKVELMEKTPNLTRIISDLNSNYMRPEDLYRKMNEFGEQAMLLLDKFVEVHPEMSDKIKSFMKTSSGDYECTLTKIKSQKTVEQIEKNLYKIDNMSPEDIEILKEILADELNWSDQTSFSGLITDCDFSIEKFDILKPLYLREKAKGDLYGYDKNKYGKLFTKDYDIDILKKVVEGSSEAGEVDNAIYALDCCDHELVKTLLFDTDFELDMIKDVVQQDINHFDRQDNTIEQVKHLAKTYKEKNISRNEAYLMMRNIKEITQDMAQKMLAKAEKSEIEHAEINRIINPQKDYQPSEMHMLSYARTLSKLINESNKELINTLLGEDYFTVEKIETICKKRFVFDELDRWSPEKDMEKALDVAKNYKQKGMTPEEAYVMLLNIPAMTKTLAQRIITRVRAEEADIAQKENRSISEENIDKKLTENARAVQPETTELAEVLLEDANLTLDNVQNIINYKNDGYNSFSAVPQIMEIAKTYKQKGIDKSVAYLMMLNPFSITERMAKKVLKQVRDEIEESKSLSSLLPNHKSRATDISRYEREGEMLVRYISADRAELAEYLLDTPEWSDRTRKIINVLSYTKDAHEVLDLCKNYEKYELTQEQAIQVIESKGEISARDLSKLNKLMGRKTVTEMNPTDRNTAVRFVDVIDVQNINEITIGGKKKLLRALVDNKDGSFQISEKLRERLPIVPKNVDEYCPLLRSIVRAIGIETEALTPEQRLQMFNSSMKDLSKSLAELSDKDFADLSITLEEPREEFIGIVKEKIKGLSDLEKRKVFDYYGFELHRNKNNSTGYTITGYPVHLNNGQKLALIENPKTKAVVEALRPDVIKFSKQNRIKCSNSQIEQLLNDVLDGLPEIRTMIGKSQHGSHDFDVMQHSLKVMQKLVQDPKFEKLSESDKKIMLLASLLHDITKGEGYSDRTHATESSFDGFYIAQKFNLSRDDVLKLYTLIEQHEWLGDVNTKRSEETLTKALQRTAFNLQNDNLFELALMFTHADLKAVRKDNSFHDKTEGPSRINFRGEVHSFGEAADIHAQRIREYVKELKANKPFTPTTRVPKMSDIKSRIGSVDSDGNVRDKAGNIINGLYLRESDGLIIIKHNEVTDWEAIGFSKGTTSKGITGVGKIRDTRGPEAIIDEAPYETGNVHYFMHGLDYPNQLMKFEAFTQPDSRAMLSVTYLERPESKPRGFRPQGVFLHFREKYVYGGGETDAGSGCGKSVDDFVRDYCFGGSREKDRTMVSELHKKSTGMSDEEYVRFIEENQNKEWTEIDPAIGNKMIKGLGDGIISTGRRHDRAYDEFYASNPDEVEATFAYEENVDLTIDNPIEFVNKNEYRLNYLIRFNHDHDIPMILLGD